MTGFVCVGYDAANRNIETGMCVMKTTNKLINNAQLDTICPMTS